LSAPIIEVVSDGAVVVHVHVQPRAGRTEITGRHGDALRIRVAAPPVDGRATDAARRALADALDVAPSAVTIVSGERSRLKRMRIDGLAADDVIQRLTRWLGPPAG
jgi:uncharacterized protein (TIGR00251 family)